MISEQIVRTNRSHLGYDAVEHIKKEKGNENSIHDGKIAFGRMLVSGDGRGISAVSLGTRVL